MPDGPWVLVVEDEDSVRDVWVEALCEAGYNGVGVGNAGEVLTWLPDMVPDLILLDMLMPEMDGFEFLARLRRNPGWDRIPVLIVSALGGELEASVEEERWRRLGVAGIVSKPSSIAVLLGHVSRIVGPATPD